VSGKPRIFRYDVALDSSWAATSPLGGITIPNEEIEWTPEHLVLAGLCRCVLTSFRHHARRAGHEPTASASGHGVVTRREADGRFAFVEIRVGLDVTLATLPVDELRGLIASAERDCFVGASLTPAPGYSWVVNGEKLE